MKKILVLNGPNLNLLGKREPAVYGDQTLDSIVDGLISSGREKGVDVTCFQSNAEHELINAVHEGSADQVEFIIINPGGFTHTSVALRDALLGVNIPFIEVHLSNVYSREAFRHHSYLSDIAEGVITGLGSKGYDFALTAAVESLDQD